MSGGETLECCEQSLLESFGQSSEDQNADRIVLSKIWVNKSQLRKRSIFAVESYVLLCSSRNSVLHFVCVLRLCRTLRFNAQIYLRKSQGSHLVKLCYGLFFMRFTLTIRSKW